MEQAEYEAKKEIGVVRQTIAKYADLMKPHVTVLLLGVTAAAMAVANQGLPPLALVIPTLLGGALGYVTGNLLAQRIGQWVFQSRIAMQPVLFPIVLGLAIVVTFAGSAASIRKAMHFDPVIILRGDA